MDSFLDDFFEEVTGKWECPECKEKGKLAEVKLYQATLDTAIFFCEHKGCRYPYTQNTETFFVKRKLMDVPVTKEMIKKANLPLSMFEEKDLQLKHLFDLCWLNNFLPFLDCTVESLKDWRECLDNLHQSRSVIRDLDKAKQFTDPDFVKLINLPDEIIEFAKHIKPDIANTIQNIKLTLK